MLFSTIYPERLDARNELFITRQFLTEYRLARLPFTLRVFIASAHRNSVDAARVLEEEFPEIGMQFLEIETEHKGTRSEEISFCKEYLPERLTKENFDYLLFMDADVWTSISQVQGWISLIGPEFAKRFIKIKYCLRDSLSSPAHTLGAYFHHKDLLTSMEYWKIVFPRYENGKRKGAPDCYLHDYLEGRRKCKKIVPEGLLTYHCLNTGDAHVYDAEKLYKIKNVRAEISTKVQAAIHAERLV